MALEVVEQMREIARQSDNHNCFRSVNMPHNQFKFLATGEVGIDGVAAKLKAGRWKYGALAGLIFVDGVMDGEFLLKIASRSGYVLLDLCSRDLDSEIRRCVQDMWRGDSSMLPPDMVESDYLSALQNKFRAVTNSPMPQLNQMKSLQPGMRLSDAPPSVLVHAEEPSPFLSQIATLDRRLPVAVATSQQTVITQVRALGVVPSIVYYAERPL